MSTENKTQTRRTRLIIAICILTGALIYLWHTHPLRNAANIGAPAPQQLPWQQYTIKANDSFSTILQQYHINYSTTLQIMKLKASAALKNLRPGDSISLQLKNNQLIQLHLPQANNKTLAIYLKNNSYHSKIITNPTQTTTKFAEGEINSSLAQTFYKQKIPPKLLAQFEKIFSWKINFKRDLRKGAKFAIIYELQQTTNLHQKKQTRAGSIILAQLINNKQNITALRYTTKNGKTDYYDSTGKSLSRKFMRAPLHYKRISSKFSLHRWHPILHKYRPHFGVDFAAPLNTPIYAIADGKIKLKEWVHGYGRTIYIRHNLEYSSRYAHLNKYAKGLKVGEQVRKGQIIGYLGKSGLATGPNLHFEIRKFGIPRNPITLKLPSADPIPSNEQSNFLAFAHRQIAALENDSKRYALRHNKPSAGPNKHG